MYVIGSQRLTVVEEKARPDGDWHAVDVDGVALCSGSRLRYVFPAIRWPESLDGAPVCDECMEMFTAPAGAPVIPQPAFEPARAMPAPSSAAHGGAETEPAAEPGAVAVAERELDDEDVDEEFAAVAAKLANALDPARHAYPAEPVPASDDDEVDPWGSLF